MNKVQIGPAVVRVRTSFWNDERGAHMRKSLLFMKKMSFPNGLDYFIESMDMIGADEVMEDITNLYRCDDGIYQLVICNEHTDWETGYMDSHEWKLVPFSPEVKP